MQLGQVQVGMLGGNRGCLLRGEQIGSLAALIPPKGAKGAAVAADIGVVDLAVEHVIGVQAVFGQTGGVGQGPQAQQVRAVHQGQAVGGVQALTLGQLGGHGF